MKTQTKALDLQKLLASYDKEKIAICTRQNAQRALDRAVNGETVLALIDPVTLSTARRTRGEWLAAKQVFEALPKPRRELAAAVKATAEKLALAAARQAGGYYSGDTSHEVEWSDKPAAWTETGYGDRYSRSCKYSKTNATHKAQLSAESVHCLHEQPLLVAMSARDGLPLISLKEDGAALWLVSKGKQIAAEAGWLIGDDVCCYHSTTSREDAVKGHAKKRAAIDRQSAEAAERERLRKASPAYKAERRARLVARLCNGITATIADARASGYCMPGIEQFQRQHGIGDTATLPELCRTGNGMAIALALKLARATA